MDDNDNDANDDNGENIDRRRKKNIIKIQTFQNKNTTAEEQFLIRISRMEMNNNNNNNTIRNNFHLQFMQNIQTAEHVKI